MQVGRFAGILHRYNSSSIV